MAIIYQQVSFMCPRFTECYGVTRILNKLALCANVLPNVVLSPDSSSIIRLYMENGLYHVIPDGLWILQTLQICHSHSYHVTFFLTLRTFELVIFALQLFGCQ